MSIDRIDCHVYEYFNILYFWGPFTTYDMDSYSLLKTVLGPLEVEFSLIDGCLADNRATSPIFLQ